MAAAEFVLQTKWVTWYIPESVMRSETDPAEDCPCQSAKRSMRLKRGRRFPKLLAPQPAVVPLAESRRTGLETRPLLAFDGITNLQLLFYPDSFPLGMIPLGHIA
jgi:hypothetical protein